MCIWRRQLIRICVDSVYPMAGCLFTENQLQPGLYLPLRWANTAAGPWRIHNGSDYTRQLQGALAPASAASPGGWERNPDRAGMEEPRPQGTPRLYLCTPPHTQTHSAHTCAVSQGPPTLLSLCIKLLLGMVTSNCHLLLGRAQERRGLSDPVGP